MSDVILISGSAKPRYERIAYRDCPRFIREAYGPRRDLFVRLEPVEWLWNGYRLALLPGAISDLTSVPWFIPRWLASRASRDNHKDWGSEAHDQGHLGVARFPDIKSRMSQAAMFDRLMLDLWLFNTDRRTYPRIKYAKTRLVSPLLFTPDYANLCPEWMTIERV